MNDLPWQEARKIVAQARSVSVCTIDSEGGPHATPIGSLILHPHQRRGYWLEKFPVALPENLQQDQRVQILATRHGYGYWLKSLWRGSFADPPALRLKGTAAPLRKASEAEKNRFLKKVRAFKSLKGHALLWSHMTMARDITIEEIIPVKIGRMWTGSSTSPG